MPKLIIDPHTAHIEQIIHIKIHDLSPAEEVEIEAELVEESSRIWKSKACFKADIHGIVDLSRQAPHSGTYQGIDPMGLFWSMGISDEEKNRMAFFHSRMDPMSIRIKVKLKSGKILEDKIIREVASQPIRKIPVLEGGIIGSFYLPQGEGPFPGVIALGGAGRRAPYDSYFAQLADKGFAVLGLHYFFSDGLPNRLKNIPAEYFYKAIVWMKQNPNVLSERLAIVGYSLGGTAALLAASLFPEIKIAVSFMGRGIVTQATDRENEQDPPASLFTYKGIPLPYLPLEIPQWTEENYKSACLQKMVLKALAKANDEMLDKASIKVENIQGPVLLFAGSDDRLIVTSLLSEISYNRLAQHNFKYDKDFIIYKGSGHLIAEDGLPYAPTTSTFQYLTPHNYLYDLGGNPKDRSDAAVDSWKKCIDFIKKHLYRS